MSHRHGALKNIQFRLSEMRSKRKEKIKTKVGVKYKKTAFNFGKLSSEELEIIKNKIQKNARIQKRKELILFIIILILIIIAGFIFLS